MRESSTPTNGATPSEEEYIYPYDAAKIALVHPKTLARWGDSGKIRMVKTDGGHRRYRRGDVMKFRRFPQTEWSKL